MIFFVSGRLDYTFFSLYTENETPSTEDIRNPEEQLHNNPYEELFPNKLNPNHPSPQNKPSETTEHKQPKKNKIKRAPPKSVINQRKEIVRSVAAKRINQVLKVKPTELEEAEWL